MTDQPMSRRRAKVQAMTLACLLMAAAPPVVAQETAPAEPATPAQTETPAPAAPGTEATDTTAPTAPAPSAPAAPATNATAPDAETAPATGTGVTGAAPAESPAPAPTSEPAAAESPATSPTTETPASDAAPVQDAPAAGEAPAQEVPGQEAVSDAAPSDPATPATDTPAPDVAASQPMAEVAEPSDSLLPDSIQRMFTPVERDPNLPHDLSPMGMFLAADWVVKAVMIGLAFASVVTWTVLLVKLIELWQAGNRAARTLRRVEGASDLAAAAAITDGRRDPGSRMVLAAMRELERSRPALGGGHGQNGLKERVASHLDQIEAAASRKIGRGTGLLATIGSTAPFVGLFGTVWGIMNSFIGISEAQTTNLAVVAPGIAEALLATALGLVAAIPAVIIYNHFARTITGYRLRLGSVGAAVQRVLSRDLDFKAGA